MVRELLSALTIAVVMSQTPAPARAGPCSEQIAQIERAERAAAPGPDAGPMAAQSVDAQLHRQPTPSSIKQAQEQTDAAFNAALARAKDLDRQGKGAECSDKVEELKRMLGIQ